MNLSLDGLMSGPRQELDWHIESWSEAMSNRLLDILDLADTLLLGRVTYEAMAPYWSFQPLSANIPRQDQSIADKMNRHTKIVFTHQPIPFCWKNTRIARQPLTEEISELKCGPGKNILVFGSAKLVSSIVQSKLVDEYQLWIHPVLLGKGIPLFNNLLKTINLKLTGSAILEQGVVVLNYCPSTKKATPFSEVTFAIG